MLLDPSKSDEQCAVSFRLEDETQAEISESAVTIREVVRCKTRATARFVDCTGDEGWGDGRHPTTALCLEYLSSRAWAGESVLDYGCGSGVLAIAAKRRRRCVCVCACAPSLSRERRARERPRERGRGPRRRRDVSRDIRAAYTRRLLGCGDVVGVDIDDEVLSAAAVNCAANSLGGEARVDGVRR